MKKLFRQLYDHSSHERIHSRMKTYASEKSCVPETAGRSCTLCWQQDLVMCKHHQGDSSFAAMKG
ncbi:hypothetical protein ACRRTK_005245 [Alexandromys fortis]